MSRPDMDQSPECEQPVGNKAKPLILTFITGLLFGCVFALIKEILHG